jgi:hypothetical protein
MFTFQDLMRQAQGGQAIENIAKAYGLKTQDVEKLTGALLPVFSLGFQKSFANLRDAKSPAEFFDGTRFKAAYDDASAAVSPAATEAARITLDKLFGSGDAADVIAGQVAKITGVGADMVAKVMPTIAATLFGGLAKELETGPFASMFKAYGADAANPMEAMAAPFKDAMNSFFKGYVGEDAKKPAGLQWPPGMEAFGKMFEPGVEIAEANAKLFEKMFDSFKR